MDGPEIIHLKDGIFENQPYGPEAAAYGNQVLKEAKRISVISVKKDKYKRDLGPVFVDGELYAAKVIKAGFAVETISYYGDGGFPGLAWQIMEAAAIAPEPAFESPLNGERSTRRERIRIVC